MSFLADECGQGMVEYALIIGLISIVVIGAIFALTDALGKYLTNISTEMNNAFSGNHA